MRAKMELKSEEEKGEGGEKTHCIICAEILEEDWIQCRICGGWSRKNCDDLEGNNLFYAPSRNFRTIPGGRRLTAYLKRLLYLPTLLTYILTCNRLTYVVDLQWNRISNMEHSRPEAVTLPLGLRGLNSFV
ncbi:hypothetical protein AVEN_235949-1 [Araneus ventricosus]|uniref:Uncharacterized protein n=1 Tax=Araneus ventricosus TaxID=182803 RepID=A0A4Y2NWI6_ARAVE|nr:hypothetical protein AVEN_235949-1 [Araneus ventricosus]